MHNNARIDQALVDRMRALVSEGEPFSEVMQLLFRSLPADRRTKIVSIEYAKEAFCLSLSEAGPIAGWEPDGTGEISNERLDELVTPAVITHQTEWERQ